MILNNKIDDGIDGIFNTKYELYKVNFGELVNFFKTSPIYKDVDIKLFDRKYYDNDELNLSTQKKSGLATGTFFAHNDNGNIYLLDGYNRIFSHIEDNLDTNFNVYLKVFTDDLKDMEIFQILFYLNIWKIGFNCIYTYQLKEIFERGFSLYIFVKYNINIMKEVEYRSRYNFLRLLSSYFTDIRYQGGFIYKSNLFETVITTEKFIDDLKEMNHICLNENLEDFQNKRIFIDEFLSFASNLRLNGYNDKIKYNYFEDKLKEDTKFFKKFIGMSGNEVTNNNAQKFLQQFKTTLLK